MTLKRAPSYSATRHASGFPAQVEWGTLALIVAMYVLWGIGVFVLPGWGQWIAAPVVIVALVLHSSLTHEVLHGHPFPSRRASEALVVWNPGLFIPYHRFRDTHLAHHQDSLLTDPYDDPESNFLDPVHWDGMARWARVLRQFNNTLAGRMSVGPMLGQIAFMIGDWRAFRSGDGSILRAWAWHAPGICVTIWLVALSPMSIWTYVACAYGALSILKIRTFLEHRAHERASARTVIVEGGRILPFLFLNNNLHVVHHMHPGVPWYRLPGLYAQDPERYLKRNDGYVYRSYAEIFRQYLFRTKDPVPHPLWPRR